MRLFICTISWRSVRWHLTILQSKSFFFPSFCFIFLSVYLFFHFWLYPNHSSNLPVYLYFVYRPVTIFIISNYLFCFLSICRSKEAFYLPITFPFCFYYSVLFVSFYQFDSCVNAWSGVRYLFHECLSHPAASVQYPTLFALNTHRHTPYIVWCP